MEAAEANSNTCVQWRHEDLAEIESCISGMYRSSGRYDLDTPKNLFRTIRRLLEIMVIKLTVTEQHHELRNGSLYSKLQLKLQESMLARYHRWIFESRINKSVIALKTWVFQESQISKLLRQRRYMV